ncbi:MAG: hypothetical protein IAC51_07645 [bacterium]|uniref:Uncharacterized protein n=1 Tax=Candidatus Aphodosoma intestinipullorum TaxID=2840674 RepID=A0A940DKL4_9BACT|nr:hypothetical protein [Candidatus Aphodosoma intestinipullorum]
MMKTLLITLLVTLVLLLVGVAAMGLRAIFVKGGKFPDIHIGSNREMRKRGITCASTQDREARKKK